MGKDVLACFLNVKEAFDNVNSDILMKKLNAMGCPHNIVNLVSFLMHKRNARLSSSATPITRKIFKGLPQGEVRSPLLYLIYVIDITVSLNPSIQISQFADDITIYCPVTIPSKSKGTLEKNHYHLGCQSRSPWAIFSI